MPRIETDRVYMRRLAFHHRNIEVKRSQTDVHLKKKKAEPRVLTPGEKEARKERRANKHQYEASKLAEAQKKVWQLAAGLSQDLGKTPEHWYQTLTQLARIAKGSRKTSLWNAFVSKKIPEWNAALKEGELKLSVKNVDAMAKLAAMWALMSEEERNTYAKDRKQQLDEDRETKAVGAHTVTVNAFHDVSATLIKIENMLRDLWLRTGAECLLFVVRSSVNHYNRPAVVESSPRVKNFFKFCFNQLPSQWVLNLEAHCVNGMEGVKNKYAEDLQMLQSECSAKILEQLQLAAAPGNVRRMNYENFGSITKRQRVVYQNWPVSFCSPVRLSVLELHTLHDLLHAPNPPPLFRKLTHAEYAVFEETIRKEALKTLPPQPPTNIPVPTLLPRPSNSVPDIRSGVELAALHPRNTMNVPSTSSAAPSTSVPSSSSILTHTVFSTSSISSQTGASTSSVPSPMGPSNSLASLPTSSAITPATPSSSNSGVAPSTPPRGGIVISFNGKQSTLVPPKPRAKRGTAGITAAEREVAKAAKAAQKQAEKAAKQSKRAGKRKEGNTVGVDINMSDNA